MDDSELPPLATVTDIEARLGRPLTTAEQARVAALLADASGKVRDYTGQAFTIVTDDTVKLRAQQGEIRLPQRPVLSVSSVTAVGAGGAPDLVVVGWQWDGLDIIRTISTSPVINLPELWYEDEAEAYPGTYRIVYSHGGGSTPAGVLAVVAAMVMRTLTAPTMAAGLTGETIGPYSYRTDGSGVGTAVILTDDDRRALKQYRRTSGMSMVRFR